MAPFCSVQIALIPKRFQRIRACLGEKVSELASYPGEKTIPMYFHSGFLHPIPFTVRSSLISLLSFGEVATRNPKSSDYQSYPSQPSRQKHCQASLSRHL